LDKVFLSLGSNLSDRAAHLASGIEELKKIPGLVFHAVSPVYETAPAEGASGGAFLNCAVECSYDGEPIDLLERLEEIERREGRKSKGDYAARPLDIDIIFFGNLIINSCRLTIPHPRLYKRMFVLVPLADLDPDFSCPKTGKTIRQLLSEISDTANIVHVRKELKKN
jgi:2-amino-4-hydroxy-6-hydroxymethyldihydropteridine diphosphokinase